MSVYVEPGPIARILKDSTYATAYTPIVQVLRLKMSTQENSTSGRWRLVLSDGRHCSQSMLTAQQNEMIESGELQEGCLIRLKDHAVNDVHNESLIIVLQLEVLTGPQGKIGDPVNLTADPDAGKHSQGQCHSSFKENIDPHAQDVKSKMLNNNSYRQGVKPKMSNHEPYGDAFRQSNNSYRGGVGGFSGAGGGRYSSARNEGYGGGNGGAGTCGGASNPNASRGTGFNSALVQRQTQDSAHVPISALTPCRMCWTIKARVTNKSDIRHWSKKEGKGHFFSVELLDEDCSKIRGTFFEADADRWFDVLQVGQVYSFTGGRIKVANKKYSSLNAEYEISFNSGTAIVPIEDDSRIQSMQYSFVKLSEMKSLEPYTIVDVIAVVKSYGDFATVNTRAGKEVDIRKLTLVDDSCTKITITLWGNIGKKERWDGSPIVVFKGVQLSPFGGGSLSTLSSSTVLLEPSIAEAHELRHWFANNRSGSIFKSVSVRSARGGGDDAA